MSSIEQNAIATAPSRGRRLRWPLMIAAPVVVLAGAAYAYLTGGRYESTDDAYVQASRVAISANVAGRVIEVGVRENQPVKAGQVLFRLDPRDFEAAVAGARAQLAQAEVQARSTQAAYAPRASELDAALVDLAYRERELARQRELTADQVGSQRELDERINDVAVARQRLSAARANASQALATIGAPLNAPVERNPGVQVARAALDRALLNLSYATVVAPQDGLVTRVEQLQVGSYVTAAQPLFTLVAPRMWVDANFKETQLNHMKVGQRGEARLDAYPGQTYAVHVESLSPGTGAAFAILPAENATGNWVKVTQRLPVRVAFDDPAVVRDRLHAGLSVRVKIDTEYRRRLLGGAAEARAATP